MSPSQDTGAQGDAFGRETAPQIADAIGATMLGETSNETALGGDRIATKCARKKTPSVGVTYKMLERIQSIVAAFETDDGSFDVFSLPTDIYRLRMTDTRSQGASSGGVGIVSRKVFVNDGKKIGAVRV